MYVTIIFLKASEIWQVFFCDKQKLIRLPVTKALKFLNLQFQTNEMGDSLGMRFRLLKGVHENTSLKTGSGEVFEMLIANAR